MNSIQRSEEPNQGMHQLPAERLQKQIDHLPKKDNQNLPVLGDNSFNQHDERKTNPRQSIVNINLLMLRST